MGEDLPGVFGQQTQQLVFDGGQMDFLLPPIGAAAGVVNFQRAVLVDAGLLVGFLGVIADPPQGDPKPGQQLLHGEGLGEIVIGAGVQGGDLVAVLAAGGDDNDGQIAPGADFLNEGDAVHIGQAQVQQDHVGAVGQGVHQSARAGFRPVEEIVLGLQGGGDEVADSGVVLHH